MSGFAVSRIGNVHAIRLSHHILNLIGDAQDDMIPSHVITYSRHFWPGTVRTFSVSG
jgi:hypothetical protein